MFTVSDCVCLDLFCACVDISTALSSKRAGSNLLCLFLNGGLGECWWASVSPSHLTPFFTTPSGPWVEEHRYGTTQEAPRGWRPVRPEETGAP